MANTNERFEFLRTELTRVLPHSMGIVLSMAMAYIADAHGYVDGSTGKVFQGEVWSLLEGHGHSVMEVAIFYGFFSLLAAGDAFKDSINAKEKAVLAVITAGMIEAMSVATGTVFDLKDILVMLPAALLLMTPDKIIETGIEKLQDTK